MAKHVLSCTVNGEAVEVLVQPYETLLDVLREDLRLTGPKEGCGTGDCGACTIHLDGKPVTSCLVLGHAGARPLGPHHRGPGQDGRAAPAAGRLRPSRRARSAASASRVRSWPPRRVLAEHPQPTEEEIRYGIAGNLCRCTGYTKMIAAIAEAAAAAPARKGMTPWRQS